MGSGLWVGRECGGPGSDIWVLNTITHCLVHTLPLLTERNVGVRTKGDHG